MCRFIETLKVKEKAIPLLDYHLIRAEATCAFHNIPSPLNTSLVTDFVNNNVPGEGVYKLRIVYGSELYSMAVSPYHIEPVAGLKVIEYPSASYSFKYADRRQLNALHAMREGQDDILLSKNGRITDTSYCNIAFFDGITWCTPDTPLLNGTRRMSLLDRGIIKARPIKRDDIHHFVRYKLFNAMIDWEEGHELPVSTIVF